MLVRAIGKGEEAKQTTDNTGFADDKAIKSSDKGYVNIAIRYDLVKGYPDNTIRPEGKTTRAEAFTLLVRKDEVLEKIRKEAEKEGEKKPPSGSSGGGSASYPRAQVAFELPPAHTDTSITVTPVPTYKTLAWSLAKKPRTAARSPLTLRKPCPVPWIKRAAPLYSRKAAAIPDRHRHQLRWQTTSCSQRIKVYPVVGIAFELPQHTHTDKTVSIEVATTGLGNLDIVWSATKDGEAVAWDTAIDGDLSNEGGTITFKEKGGYGITATVTDDTGRSFSHSSSITVYPVASVDFDLPEKAHTDTTIDLITTLSEMDGLSINWGLTRNGEVVAIGDYLEGELTNAGGAIRFKEKGVYALTATVTDATGRE